ncbi:MAG: hypothetical protein FJW40_11570 [Acidobacteria bacterium]|nr:hypothetical protein [Acidobacteriota bacterium]
MGPACARWSLTVGMLLQVVTGAAGQTWTPERFWQQRSGYAGSEACRNCHSGIYDKQEASSHARTLRPLSEVAEFKQGLPFELLDRVGNASLRLSRDPSGSVLLSSVRGGEQTSLSLRWAFGAGAKVVTPVTVNDRGDYVESRVSWFRGAGVFDLTPGARERVPGSFAETLGQILSHEDRKKCFGCHTSRPMADDPVPARNEMGIRCERCHGPGLEHVRAASADSRRSSILHPRKLTGFQMAQVCGACHGRPPREIDFHEIRQIQERPLAARFPSQRLVLSRCFNETDGGLKCTVCHDPHDDVASSPEVLDTPCRTCHSTGRKSAAICPKASSNCSRCHMPKARVLHHTEFADHWIRAKP